MSTNAFLHENLYRGAAALEKIARARFVICGAGALGSPLVDNLVRHGARDLKVIDQDRVEEHNIGAQVYDQNEIGAWKVQALAERSFRATGIEIEAVAKELNEGNVKKFLREANVVIDVFDNSHSRRVVTEYCCDAGLNCLHLGVNEDYGQVRWNENYRVPGDVLQGDNCDYPLARNLSLFIVALGTEAVLRFIIKGQKENYSFTLGDLAINCE
jgi:molybdopterin/thiamine biosynthesis adenylyltransferase